MNKDGERLLDELHCRLSELKIRVAKLEQYARLQDDLNRASVHYLKPNITVINNDDGMTFEEAITCYKKGKDIRRKSWIKGSYICKKFTSFQFQFSFEDIMGNDWEVADG